MNGSSSPVNKVTEAAKFKGFVCTTLKINCLAVDRERLAGITEKSPNKIFSQNSPNFEDKSCLAFRNLRKLSIVAKNIITNNPKGE